MQFFVNDQPETLNSAIRQAAGIAPSIEIHWRSPLADDEFAEYFDQSFLDRLPIVPPKKRLLDFWPSGGPHWDGVSRAREVVILLASRSEMEEPYLRPLVDSLAPRVLRRHAGQVRWASVDLSLPVSPSQASPPSENNMGGQIAKRKMMKPVLSQEQQRLSNLDLDGKPRLVRGVAGSGKTVVLSNWLAKTAKRMAGDPDARIWAVYANRSLHKLLQESIEGAWKGSGEHL